MKIRNYFKDFCKPYWFLVLLRIITVFLPQTGYIHPDEYFQSIEVLSGHFFDIEIDKPWEFNSTFPIRSVGVNYITVGFSYMILKLFNSIFGRKILTPYTLVVFPRLFICILSFLIDYTLYKLSLNNNENYKAKLTILASSYVIIVYGTRTFSNVFELVLLSLLLFYVTDSMIFSNIIVKQHEYLNKRYDNSETNIERARIHKLRLLLSPHSFKNCFQISSLTVIGFFNRPTFLAFAICPVFFWLYRGIGFKSVTIMQFHYRMLGLLICSIPTVIFFVLVDSFYYGYLSLAEIEFSNVNINNFIFTPLNFLKYNMDSGNLAIHGLHPRYLHTIVNLPLLFNVLAILNFISIAQMVLRFLKGQIHYLPTVRSIKGLMIATLIVPVLILSIFPHQEPRFLIPIIVPVVYLHAETILPEIESTITKKFVDEKISNRVEKKLNKTNYNHMLIIWLIINVIMIIFYGFLHQGGVYSATVHLSDKLRMKQNTNFYVVTSHIYSIPESLFLQKSTERMYIRNNMKYKLTKRIHLHQEGSEDLALVIKKISYLIKEPKKESEFYFIFPSSLQYELDFTLKDINSTFNFTSCVNFFPHLSTEAMPKFNITYDMNNFSISKILDNIFYLKYMFTLQLCKIS